METSKINYVKVSAPDQDKLAELTLAAIGARTKQQFAMLCGVQPSTISRLINKSNKGASTEELIQAIAKNAAPDSGVTLGALMKANGMVPESDLVITPVRATQRFDRYVRRQYDAEVQSIILEELLLRGAEVRIGNIRYEISKSLTLRPDTNVMTNVIEGDEHAVWLFENITPFALRYPEADYDRLQRIKKVNSKHQVFDRISRYSFLSMNKIEIFRPKRFSIITSEADVFDMIVDEFAEMRVPTQVTFILVDIETSKVVKEIGLPDSEGNLAPCYFMEHNRDAFDEGRDFEDPIYDFEEEDLDD